MFEFGNRQILWRRFQHTVDRFMWHQSRCFSLYLVRLARPGLKITRIAHGLPAGTGLEFADELTLSRALEGRRELNA